MQISIETTTQSTSLFSASFSGNNQNALTANNDDGTPAKPEPVNVLEAASKKAEEDAAVIATLREAIEEGRGEDEDDGDNENLATVEDYQKAAGQLKSALGESGSAPDMTSAAYESATISTTTIEAEIGGETISAQFVSYERVSYNSETGLSVRSASASSIEGDFANGSFSYQNASVSELYAGTGEQVSNLASLVA